MKTVGLILLCVALTATAFPQKPVPDPPATRADVDQLFQAMGINDQVRKSVEAMMFQVKQMMDQANEDKLAVFTPEQRDKLHKEMDEIFADMIRDYPWQALIDNMAPVYQKHLTRGDVQAMVKFYSSPVGKKVLAELPAIQQESMQANTQVVQEFMRTQMAQSEARIKVLVEGFLAENTKKKAEEAPKKDAPK